MILKIKGKEVETKFTFNSFKYMREFDMGMINEMENKPFLFIPIAEGLLIGAVNHDPTQKFTLADVDAYLGAEIDDTDSELDLIGLIEELVTQLEEANFFKKLQGKK